MNKPCPFCGSDVLTISFNTSYGHGDSGYSDLRIVCRECDATKGKCEWGRPSDKDIQLAWDAWNKRVSN